MIIGSIVVFSLVIDNYMSGRFFNRVTQSVAVTAVIAAGQALVIITRNIDLSVGSIAGVSAYLTGDVLGDHLATTPVVAVLLAVAIGTLLGLVNGLLVAYGRIPSIIVTLGTLAIYRTWLISYAEARTITASSLPQWLVDLPRSTVFTIGDYEFRTMFVMAIVVVIVLQCCFPGSAGWTNPLRHRLQPGGCTAVRSAGAAHHDRCLHGLWSSRRARRIPRARPLRHDHGVRRAGPRAGVDRRSSRWRGEHARWLGDDRRQLLRAVLIGLLDQSIVRVPQISEFVRDAVLGLLILLAVVLDGLLARRFVHRRTIMAMGTAAAARTVRRDRWKPPRRRSGGGR